MIQEKNKIVLVEDDKIIARELKNKIEDYGYRVKLIENFENTLEEIKDFSPQLLILDINLPYTNGFTLCKEVRSFSKIPILFISSREDTFSFINAISYGGDDLLVKPFESQVLIMKIQALLRRSYDYTKEKKTFKDYTLSENMTLKYKDSEIELSKNEYKILSILFSNPNRVVTRREIIEYLWDSQEFIDDNTLTVNINRLRKKLKANEINDFIETKVGLGYKI